MIDRAVILVYGENQRRLEIRAKMNESTGGSLPRQQLFSFVGPFGTAPLEYANLSKSGQGLGNFPSWQYGRLILSRYSTRLYTPLSKTDIFFQMLLTMAAGVSRLTARSIQLISSTRKYRTHNISFVSVIFLLVIPPVWGVLEKRDPYFSCTYP